VEHYNNVRLNSATGYITPKDVLAGRQHEIHAERDRKLEAARQQRQSHRQQAARRAKRPAIAMWVSRGKLFCPTVDK
jgi:putative transposase